MARFETTGQVLGLFLGAAVVAILCIVFLTAEAHKREMVEDEDEVRVEEKGVVERLQGAVQSFRNFFVGNNQEDGEVKRYKRDTGDDMLNDFVFGHRGEFKRKDETKEPGIDVATQKVDRSLQKEKKHKQKDVLSDIDEALVSEAFSHHKIRHIQEKIGRLSLKHQVVKAVLDKFCVISPCPATQCPICKAINCSLCRNSNNNSSEHTNNNNNNNSSNTINNNNRGNTINNNNSSNTINNKTSGCPAITCPTEHIKHQFPHTYTYQHSQFRQEIIPASTVVCSTNTEVIVIILLTSITNFIIFTIFFFCLKARVNFQEELMSDEDKDAEDDPVNEKDNGRQYFGAKSLKPEQRRYSFSDIGYNQSPKYTVLEEYGFVV